MSHRGCFFLLILAFAPPLHSATCGSGTQVLTNGVSDRLLLLPAGGDPAPAGYESPAFDDSAWQAAVDFPGAWSGPKVGVPWSSYDPSGVSDGDDVLLVRRAFSVPLSATSISASLDLAVDDNSVSALNGVGIQADAGDHLSGLVLRTFSVGGLVPGLNVLALRVQSPLPTDIGYTYRLTLLYDFECPTATPTLSPTPTPTASFTVSPTRTPSPTVSPTFSVSPTFTASPTPTPTSTASPTPSISPTASATSTVTATPSISPTFSVTATYSASPTPSVTRTPYLQDPLLSVRGLYPNPFFDRLHIALGLKEPGELSMRVYNVAGETVAQWELALPAGLHITSFDGLNGAGAALASGVYLLRIRARGASGEGAEAWERFVIAR